MSVKVHLKRALCAIFIVALLPAVAVVAQTPPDPTRTVPQGSPLNGNSSSGNDSNSATLPIPNPLSALDPISPAQVFDTSSGLLTAERLAYQRGLLDEGARLKPADKPGEFEEYVARVLGRRLPRFGSNLLLPASRDFATPATASVPPDYILNVGDVVAISMTGSIEGSVEREIDNDGEIFLPKVGSISLAGIRYADVHDRVSAAIGRQYRGYTVNVGIRRLRGIRVYVTGFANNPGAFTVSSLSTMANAVFSAGGPNSGGSFRSVKLYRRGAEVADFDLYQLVRGGDRLQDVVLQNEDVLFIPPAGPQVAVIGSVNEEAIYEAKPGESVETLLAYGGGPNSLGDPSRVILYRTSDPRMIGAQQISRAQAPGFEVAGGDIVQVLSQGTLIQPMERQAVLVRIEGEVNNPGNYYVAPNTPLNAVLATAGGLTPRAFAFGTRLTRVSVKLHQRESYAEAIKQLELSLAASPIIADESVGAAERQSQLAGAREVLERLREAEPDGRVVMEIHPEARGLPGHVLLENNDTVFVPPRLTTVGVFGAVYRPASFLLPEDRVPRVRDFIDRAGGTLRAADQRGIFVVRANGEVLSRRRGALNARVLPGDVIFVPIKTQSNSFWAKLRDISTTLFQVGLSAATFNTIVR